MKDDIPNVLTGEFNLDDLADFQEAVSAWEQEYDSERSFLKHMLEGSSMLDPDDMDIPEEKREEFGQFLEGLRKKWKRRDLELSGKQPQRYTRATILKAKILMAKGRLMQQTTDRLLDPGTNTEDAPVEDQVTPFRNRSKRRNAD